MGKAKKVKITQLQFGKRGAKRKREMKTVLAYKYGRSHHASQHSPAHAEMPPVPHDKNTPTYPINLSRPILHARTHTPGRSIKSHQSLAD